MKYYKGRDNLACTVFVPFRCGNNCPFCNTKQMYNNFVFSKDYINNIIKAIKRINKSEYVEEYVITGGEPLFNLSLLKKIVDAMDKPVYINTSLPDTPDIDKCIDYINNEYKIKSISISRHIDYSHDVNVCDIEKIDTIKKYVRINTVIDENKIEKILPFFDKWAAPYRMVNLRADYRNINSDNLKNRDKISEYLLNNFCWEYSNGCLVCNSEFYSDENYKVICYHRGLEHSCAIFNERCYVNDILIDMYGNVYKDWDMIKDPEFEKWLFE